MKIELQILHHYTYGIAEGVDEKTGRKGWRIIRQRVTPLLRFPIGKAQMLDHCFWSKTAAVDALNKVVKYEKSKH